MCVTCIRSHHYREKLGPDCCCCAIVITTNINNILHLTNCVFSCVSRKFVFYIHGLCYSHKMDIDLYQDNDFNGTHCSPDLALISSVFLQMYKTYKYYDKAWGTPLLCKKFSLGMCPKHAHCTIHAA